MEPDRAGLAAALLNSSQQVGGALGLAAFSAIGAARVQHLLSSGTPVPDATTSGMHYALAAGAAFTAAAAVIALATKNTYEDAAHQAVETEGDQPQRGADLATPLENR